MDTIREKLRYFRKERGLSIDQLGKRAGYTNGTMISQIEQGIKKPSHRQLLAIARALEVSVSDLAGDTPLCREITNNANGDHQVVYQHVEQVKGPLLMTDDFEDRLRTMMEEVVDVRCQQLETQLVEKFRTVLREAAREADDAPDAGVQEA